MYLYVVAKFIYFHHYTNLSLEFLQHVSFLHSAGCVAGSNPMKRSQNQSFFVCLDESHFHSKGIHNETSENLLFQRMKQVHSQLPFSLTVTIRSTSASAQQQHCFWLTPVHYTNYLGNFHWKPFTSGESRKWIFSET